MRLFTSNSRFGLIAGTLFGSVILMALYQVLILSHWLPPSDGINLWEENQIRAQRYALQTEPQIGPVMVGSSLTANIKAEYVGKDMTNLGMSAGSVRTGLELVARSPVQPSVVLVEVQEPINRPLDHETVADVTQPSMRRARQIFPILRRDYQPVSVLVFALKNLIKRRASKKQLDDASAANPAVHTMLVNESVAVNQHALTPLETARFAVAIRAVKDQIARLRLRGIPVILHEIPGERVILQTPRQLQIDAMLRSEFPNTRYHWLPQPPKRLWTTNDGEHLTHADAQLYGQFLAAQLEFAKRSGQLAGLSHSHAEVISRID